MAVPARSVCISVRAMTQQAAQVDEVLPAGRPLGLLSLGPLGYELHGGQLDWHGRIVPDLQQRVDRSGRDGGQLAPRLIDWAIQDLTL